MRFFLTLPFVACLVSAAHSDELADPLTNDIVTTQILPAFTALSDTADAFAANAPEKCHSDPEAFKKSYGSTFDAWIRASHWRFGPTETDARGFSLAFWPDNRGRIAKSVNGVLRSENRKILEDGAFAQFSVAGKGFYALDHLLFDEAAQNLASADYRCDLASAMAVDIAATAQAIKDDWQQNFTALMQAPSRRYQSTSEAHQELFKALGTGLQIIDELRLARPLGSFDAPRPRRAEAWRSGRSQRHVILSLEALAPLAHRLSADAPELQLRLDAAFGRSLKRARALDDPTFAGVSDPQSRIRIEALKQSVVDLRNLVTTELGPRLGVDAGFNSLDGD
ncbi:peptidase M75 [Epibacterium sp. SM1969]|uniref:Peptidase M75 n=1 Tax=Tritonibacter aquimaris TaxID=2663379 RepID=A0A844AM61_9RHOB|nr:imelysin family protein [Tritonibacter aquimaris]MQY43215.1 peptidase M75 [Tritonibacter aquimaris]